jgi:hypothetical protein
MGKPSLESRFQAASILLETIVCLLITSIFFIGLLKSITSQNIQQRRLSKHILKQETISNILQLLSIMISELDYHRFNLAPKVFTSNSLSNSSGQKVLLPKTSLLLENSVAVASTELYANSLYQFKSSALAKSLVCKKFSSSEKILREASQGLVFSKNSVYQVKIISKKAQNDDCYELLYGTCPSFLVENNSLSSPPLIFIPIKRQYVIYSSQKKEFRYLGLECNKIVENQPLGHESPQFFAKVTFVPELETYQLAVNFPDKKLKNYASTFTSNLKRSTVYDYAYN